MMNTESLRDIQNQLRYAILELDARCLYASSKWCAELLHDIGSDLLYNRGMKNESPLNINYPISTSDVCLAKVYFQMKEFKRCAHALENNKSQIGLFMRSYSTYLTGERAMQQARIEAKDPLKIATAKNTLVQSLFNSFRQIWTENSSYLDGYNLFMFALLWKSLGNKEQARTFLIKSVHKTPLNWSAWLTLAELIENRKMLQELENDLPSHWSRQFFLAHITTSWTDTESMSKAHDLLQSLSIKFQESTWVVAKSIRNQYMTRKFTDAQSLCKDLLKQDPFRLDDMDIYSHILYVKESTSELSRLAHHAIQIDKYRAETCSIVGNYYSLKGSHEKAITYFNRALKLQPHNLEVLTLIGHEFVEMRNAAAALQAYRRVIDSDPGDYKAWYGLGQTYEILEMPSYAIYYFRKACEIQPYDYRMWNAVGKCYENLKLMNDAIESYKKAEVNGDEQGLSVYNLGRLHQSTRNHHVAVKYFEKFVKFVRDSNKRSLREKEHYHKALFYLGESHARRKEYKPAESYLRPLLDFPGNMKQKAEELLNKMQQEDMDTMNIDDDAHEL